MTKPDTAARQEPPGSLDTLDHALVRVLARDPRAAFADVAAQVGVHERTVARRLERLVATGKVRFTATLLPEYLSEGLAVELAVRCAPGTLHDTAVALAARGDTRSVEISTGAPEVFAEFLLPDHDALLTTIDGSIGRIPGVVDIHSSVVLRLLLTANDWAPYDDEPTPVRRRLVEGGDLPAPLVVDDLDRRLVALLKRDARMPMAGLAGELCVGESTARRRLARLMRSHILHLRLHIEPAALGFPVEARFQLTVEHRSLDTAVRRLAQEPAIRHLVLTTGRADILGYSSHRSTQDLYAFTARVFSELEGLRGAETAVLLRTYKRVGIVTGGAL
ncbi:Lrp/AsnC family transcriptional regulator [Streptomyces sp. NPDC046862]|uniref:Lrp/AsnC family transcriptional regulator n=1 Tax=Streptomyces sp. NPDC046862 TaxID=3154603 RepID=UPI0034521F35